MQLIRLVVSKNDEIIREVRFKDGINIITNTGLDGNQIGKSTTLRAINFCLGSSGESLWLDPDNKVKNNEIYEAIVDGNIKFNLLIDINGEQYNIFRQFEKRKSRLYRISSINGLNLNSQESFKKHIASIFSYNCTNPSFPTIKNRFIRLDKSVANGILKYNNTYTSDDQYRLIYSHIFGFDGHKELEKEYNNKMDITSMIQRIRSLLNGNTESEYIDKLRSIDTELNLLYEKEEDYDIVGIHHDGIENIRICRKEISRLSTIISNIEIRLNYNNETIVDYESKISNIDAETVFNIYEEAITILPDVKKSFEDVLSFHNSLFKRKADYVREQNKNIISEIDIYNNRLDIHLNIEKSLVKDISNESHLAGFILIEKEIQNLRETRGRYSYIIDEVNNIKSDIKDLETQNLILKDIINHKLIDFKEKISIFNRSCNEITKKVFRSFSLYFGSPIDQEQSIKFSLVNIDKTSGDGSPRAAAMALDMAFVDYVKKTNAKLPAFTLQDYLEATDLYKLTTLIKLANEKRIQTVISVLNDKLSLLSEDFIKNNVVLFLSKEDKFFKVL
ncbi:hypothetical protein [Photobacterium phosphoreum]|uniref:hypothetical protein n=1 Tax=Photobacterium phosphoreum TaxID=659 RepID=UPI001E4559EA|nr:hypothetical protein [Photobacterium phosphoreum]MCD9479348.1 DUF2326 domain-containing protein [Photobacterium phosphoreum]